MRGFVVLLWCALVMCVAAPAADAQYMFLDSNGDGVTNANDRLNPNGMATNVRVFVITNQNRDGSPALCNSDDDNGNPPGTTPLTINSYALNLAVEGGAVAYSGFSNQQSSMVTPFGEINAGDGFYKNGFGGATILNPGTYHLANLTITGVAGSPSIRIVDQIAGSPDFTSFGTRCDGNGFDSTYKLDGPNTQTLQAGDWFDADGLAAAGSGEVGPPVLAPIGNKSWVVGCPLTFTATATDPDAGQSLTFSLGAGAPLGATIGASTGSFSWSPVATGSYSVTILVTDNGAPPQSDSETIIITIGSAPNTAPVLGAVGNKTVNEGALLSFTATATDPEVIPPQTFNFSLGAGAPAGASIGSTSGVFTWTPTEGQGPGVYPVTIIVTDNGGPCSAMFPLSDSETIQVTVNEVNTAPVLNSIGNKTFIVGVPVTFTASATDADVPANTLTFSLGAGAPAGATINGTTGAFSWTPTSTGPFSVTVIVADNGSPFLSDSETILLQHLGEIGPPVLAAIGNKTVAEGSVLTFTASATSSTGGTISYTLGAGAPAGTSIHVSTGVFTWTPTEAQGPGVFPITIIATENTGPNLSDSETIQVTVTEANVAPVLSPIGNKSGTVGAPVTFTATATDADIPANTLTFSLGAGAPSGATINAVTGAFSWTPTACGTFPVTVIVSDNGSPPLSDSETITIDLGCLPNTAPILNPIGDKTVNEGALLSFTATATDPDAGQTLTFSLGAGAPAGATITTGGAFTWTPTEAQGGSVFPITIRVTDNGSGPLSDTETIQVTVTEMNVAPVLASIGSKSVGVGGLLTFTATATDADIPAQTLTFTLGPGAPAGATIGAASGVFNWTPLTFGSFSVTIIVTDNGTPLLNDSETVPINVTQFNFPILAPIGNKTVNEQTLLSFTATATDADIPAQTLTFSLDAGAPAGAAITAGGAFTWTPTELQGPGTFPITVRVTDDGTGNLQDSETIQVTVNEVNVAPILAVIGNKTVAEGSLLSFTATATDADVPANIPFTFSLGAGAPAGASITTGGAFTWTPTEAQGQGSFPITIRVTDNGSAPLSDTETIQVTVTEMNVAPVLASIGSKTTGVGVPLTFTATATDADLPANTLSFSLGAGAPAGATIGLVTGVFNWTPPTFGSFSVTVVVTDNGTPSLNDSETVQIQVTQQTVAPTLALIGNKTVNELALLSFTATATDPDIPAQTLTFSLDGGAPLGASINASLGVFTWTPNEFQGPGIFPITIRVTDGLFSDTETIQVTVNEVNNSAPVLAPIGNRTVDEQVLLAFTATATDADVPATTRTFSLGAGNPLGSAITAGGAFTWTPAETQGGAVYPVTVIVTDNGLPALNDTELIQITVNETNIAPFLNQPANVTVEEGQTATQQLLGADNDIPLATLTYSKVSGPVFLTVSNGGLVTVAPTLGDAGTHSATVQVSDGQASAMRSFSITVIPGEFTPAADAGGPYSGAIGAAVPFDGSGSSDPHGAALTYSWDFGDGTTAGGVNPVHAYAATGSYTVTLTVNNGTLSDTDVTTATIVAFFSTNVFVTGGNKTVRLGSGKPQTCVHIEPEGGAYDASDVDLSSIRMLYGSGVIPAISDKAAVGDDKNQNGVAEITACFSKEDLRVLFAGLSTNDIDVVVRGNLVSGGTFEGTVVLHVVNNGNFLAATISPNPLNPKATLSFSTSGPGAVRVQMYDVQGRLIRTLMDDSQATGGYHDVSIDGYDANGERLASGMYYVKIRSSMDGEITKAVTVLK